MSACARPEPRSSRTCGDSCAPSRSARPTTYGALATQLGNPRLAQSVGRAVGRNPASIIIPCHRLVGATGGLTGFAGGLELRFELLSTVLLGLSKVALALKQAHRR
jgi:O-6-methylguanine DNA methyltransferase